MRRAFVPRIALVFLIALVAFGCGASARTTTLRTSMVALNVARDTNRALSKEREKQIVADCNPPSCTKEEGHARLDAWRVLVDTATTAIDDGYDAILAAFILDDAKSADAAAAAVAKALDLVKGLKNPTAPSKTTPADKPTDKQPANKEIKP